MIDTRIGKKSMPRSKFEILSSPVIQNITNLEVSIMPAALFQNWFYLITTDLINT